MCTIYTIPMTRLGSLISPLYLLTYRRWELCQYLRFTCLKRLIIFFILSHQHLKFYPGFRLGSQEGPLSPAETQQDAWVLLKYGVQKKGSELPGRHTRARTLTHFFIFPFQVIFWWERFMASTLRELLLLRASCIHGRANYRPKHYWGCTGQRCSEWVFLSRPPWSKGYWGFG